MPEVLPLRDVDALLEMINYAPDPVPPIVLFDVMVGIDDVLVSQRRTPSLAFSSILEGLAVKIRDSRAQAASPYTYGRPRHTSVYWRPRSDASGSDDAVASAPPAVQEPGGLPRHALLLLAEPGRRVAEQAPDGVAISSRYGMISPDGVAISSTASESR